MQIGDTRVIPGLCKRVAYRPEIRQLTDFGFPRRSIRKRELCAGGPAGKKPMLAGINTDSLQVVDRLIGILSVAKSH
jgi:hypothetical protein